MLKQEDLTQWKSDRVTREIRRVLEAHRQQLLENLSFEAANGKPDAMVRSLAGQVEGLRVLTDFDVLETILEEHTDE